MNSIYLDNAATTFPKPEEVYKAVDEFMRKVGGSAGRSSHHRAVEAGRIVLLARDTLAGLFNVPDPLRIAFTQNATEALNMVILGLLEEGDHVVTTSVEHNSVMRPLEASRARGVRYSVANCAPDGRLNPKSIDRLITRETSLIIINHASNVAGTILPVADVASIGKKRGIPVAVDAAQTAGRLPIDVRAEGIDILVFTGHKELFGPQGTGGLFVREGLEVKPLVFGGTGSHSASLAQPDEFPDRLESGTLNAPGLAGLAAGVRFVREKGVEEIREYELQLLGRLLEGLKGIPGVIVHGPGRPEQRVGIVPLTFERNSTSEVAELLDSRCGICCRSGIHCSPMAHRTIGTIETGAVRLSMSCLNTTDEVEYLLESLAGIVD